MSDLKTLNLTLNSLEEKYIDFYKVDKLNKFFNLRNEYNDSIVKLKVLLYKTSASVLNFSEKLSVSVISNFFQDIIEQLDNCFIQTSENVVAYLKTFDNDLKNMNNELNSTMLSLFKERSALSSEEIQYGEAQSITTDEMLVGKNKIIVEMIKNFLSNCDNIPQISKFIEENFYSSYVDKFEYSNVKHSVNEIVNSIRKVFFELVSQQFSGQEDVEQSYKEVISDRILDVENIMNASNQNVDLIEGLYDYYKVFIKKTGVLFDKIKKNFTNDDDAKSK